MCLGPDQQISFPRDFLEEVEQELRNAQRRLGRDHEHVAQLESLYRVTHAVASRLGRQITVFDVIRSADQRIERERRERLIRALRVHRPCHTDPKHHNQEASHDHP